MPLHLLGKKSWNVYNQANIERVRRDEAEAAAREEAEEQRQQENDAARRLAILRGEEPPPLLAAPETCEGGSPKRHRDRRHSGDGDATSRHDGRRKRKRHGEDDTDFEMRLAQDRIGSRHGGDGDGNQEHGSKHRHHGEHRRSDAPIVDHAGHIDLFPEERDRAIEESEGRIRDDKRKNPDAEREKARKQRELEDQYTMKFSNAAGRDSAGQLTTGIGPWYAGHGSFSEEAGDSQAHRKDAFGREDPGRKVRDEMRIDASDPLAMMKRGAAKVREVEKERQKINQERERELRALQKEERKYKRRRHRSRSVDSLGGISTDRRGERSKSSRHHRREDKYRSRERPHDDERPRRKHRDNDEGSSR